MKYFIQAAYAKHIIALLSTFICIHISNGQSLITVKQDGSGDFTQIQAAIDASTDSDTVLVWPGRYYENIKFNHKGITLASLHFTTNDPAYIDQTIIDANQNGCCIFIDTITTVATVHGFTLTNGSGWLFANGLRVGGGIIVKDSDLTIDFCKIRNNSANRGGGIDIGGSSVSIKNSLIAHNFANQHAGGIWNILSNLYLSNTSISNNHCYINGGGIGSAIGGIIDFDSINLCNIYNNYAAYGSDIYKVTSDNPPMKLYLDTFTVINPDKYHLYSRKYDTVGHTEADFIYYIEHGRTQMINNNLYVSPMGDDNNDGLSAETPLQSIAFAMAKVVSDSMHPNTIFLSDGVYAPSLGEKFPIGIKSYINIVGLGPDSTVLDAEQQTTHFGTLWWARKIGFSDMTILNSNGTYHGFYVYPAGIALANASYVNIDNLHFINGMAESTGGCVLTQCHNVIVRNCVFHGNYCNYPFRIGTFYDYDRAYLLKADTIHISNTLFEENQPPVFNPEHIGGTGASVRGTQPYNDSLNVFFSNCAFTDNFHFSEWPQYAWSAMGVSSSGKVTAVNCTFSGNYSENPNVKAMGVTSDSEMNLYNCILYNNPPGSMYMFSYDDEPLDTCKLNVYNSLFEGGPAGISYVGGKNIVNYDASNIDTDPMFYAQGDFPYSLSAGSPCIDAGTLDLPPEIELPETDLAGNPRVYNGYIDMGAYEYGPWVGVPSAECRVPSEDFLKVYPNPFRFETNISYIKPESGECIIRVYDLNGRCVKTLMDGQGQSGKGSMKWNGKNDRGQELNAGTYIVSIIVNGKERDAEKVVKL